MKNSNSKPTISKVVKTVKTVYKEPKRIEPKSTPKTMGSDFALGLRSAIRSKDDAQMSKSLRSAIREMNGAPIMREPEGITAKRNFDAIPKPTKPKKSKGK